MTLSHRPPDNGPAVAASVPFARDLATHGDRIAVITADGELSYADLASRVEMCAERLGTTRRLVLIAGGNHLTSLVSYLAALSAGHVALLASSTHLESVANSYDPDVVVGEVDGDWRFEVRRDGSAHELYPDLALLMSTSGSTGSPKLVRLSHQNLQSNAESIAGYLGIRRTDRAATTLSMHYCYGLSVVNSHLVRGAGVLLTDLSVVDACFWDLFRDHRGSTFAGVPYTFDLLDRVGFAGMRLPHLRYVTQAGGKLAADRVRHYAELGQERGWDLIVMYGQTEATARMSYLPPDLVMSSPHTIGIPIPGGSFSVDLSSGDGPDTGELVYDGPNVMLGYAQTPADLRLGRTVTSLRTGDLARRTDEGLYEIVGRHGRFVKIVGLRVDLQHLETLLAGQGVAASCTSTEEELTIAFEGDHDANDLRRHVTQACGLPVRALRLCPVDQLPRLATGKPDYQAVLDLPSAPEPPAGRGSPRPASSPDRLRELYAELLQRPDATEDSTFVGLGGDSLSYVEMTVRLEEALGQLPAEWHTTQIRDLSPRPPRRLLGARTVETSVLLRAMAIVAILGTHAGLFTIRGGAHALLAVAGFNFARFRLTSATRTQRLRQQMTSIARIAVPGMVWIAAVLLVTGQYSVANVFLLNGFLGSSTWDVRWHFWFVEILVYILLGLTALLAIPWVDRWERRSPFGFVMVLLVFGLLTRFELIGLGVPHMLPALWLFALGWATARASTWWQRLLVTAVIIGAVPGFFGNLPREAVLAAALTLLVWAANVPCPALISRGVGILASASLYIYLTHWQVYPHFTDPHPAVAVLASLVAGIGVWWLATRLTASAHSRHQAARRRESIK